MSQVGQQYSALLVSQDNFNQYSQLNGLLESTQKSIYSGKPRQPEVQANNVSKNNEKNIELETGPKAQVGKTIDRQTTHLNAFDDIPAFENNILV